MQEIHWGILVALYLFLAGAGAGTLFISGYLTVANKPNENEKFDLSKLGAYAGTVLLIVGVSMIVLDLSTFAAGVVKLNFNLLTRFIRLFMAFVPGSMMSLGTWLLAISIPVSMLYCLCFSNIELLSKMRKQFAVVMMILSVLIASYTAFLLGDIVTNYVWHNSIIVFLFMISALSSGMAVILFIKAVFKTISDHNSDVVFAKVDLAILALELIAIFVFCYFVYTSSKTSHLPFVFSSSMIVGVFWWAGVIGIGVLIPILLNYISVKKAPASKINEYLIALTVLIGAFCLRYSILLAGQWNL